MSTPHEINQRDLKLRASEIMDAVERGETFTVTRNGRRIATVTPIGPRPTFVPKERIAAAFSGAPVLDNRRFRDDVRALFEESEYDPFDRAREAGRDA
ncbi:MULTISPECIES: type II toxin-antitoxin system Phd/YefM family antitoxin [unclassified Nocardia]|uniref:type II toxin-antitoxin system Phd/YefM family antitoxin n=1 Tax=unclassified Nocardia TaxID=2637762 RepID=UPI001CE4B415|nr:MULTISPECIES: type II toxin-antitoxin system prevent-host-death family antitoxin [unclassified Nocardia]